MPAIRVQALSKEYTIGTREQGQDNLRETLARGLVAPFRRLRRLGGHAAAHERFWALKDVGFEVAEGEAVGIIGRNGAGKSTLLKILSRITAPTKGRVELRGRVSSLLEVGTGFHPELTGRENIFLNGAILGMRKAEIKRKFDEIVMFSEIEKFIDTPVKRYSSGMYVRLAFSVAAHLEPEILVVDEVLAVGDAEFQQKCLGKMKEVGKEGRTVLFVSHNMSAVKTLCSKAILLQNGRKCFEGSALAAVSRYANRESGELAVVSWEPETAPAVPSAHLKEVGLLSNGRQVGTELPTESPIQVYIVFEVIREEKVGTTVILRNSEGQAVFVSLSNHEPRWHGKIRRKGIYKSVCEIPPDLLADGRYSVSVVLWEGHYRHAITEGDVLGFSAHEKGRVRGDLPYEMRDGIIRPLLKWSSDFEGN